MLAAPRRTPSYQHTEPKQYQVEKVSAGWHHGSRFSSASPPGMSMCSCRGGRAWEGGGGRVQVERPTRTRPHWLGHPLAREVARLVLGWLSTIMASPVQPCPQPNDTHPEHPRRRSGDMDPPAGDTSVVCGSCGRSYYAGLDRRHLRCPDVSAGHTAENGILAPRPSDHS